MKTSKKIGEILYLSAFVLWLFAALVKYTYFKDLLPMGDIARALFYTAQFLLLIKLTLDFEFHIKQIAGLFLLLLYMTIAWSGGRVQFATMFALIYCAKNVPFDKILKTALVAQLCLVVCTVVASQNGILEDYIWIESTRRRHGLGFTHCMLASHFGLYLSLIYMAIVKKMTFLRASTILLVNGVLYYFAVGRTDLYLSVLFVVMAFVFGNIGNRLKGEKILGVLVAVLPLVLFAVSVFMAVIYDPCNEQLFQLNAVLNNRLELANEAIQDYGFSLFGKKIKWIGASVLYYDPTAVYNYVDSSYLMMSFSYGVPFVIGYCLATGYVLYRKMIQKETMVVVCLLVTLAFGVINPQSMYLTYNPFLVLLAEAWNPKCKKV